MAVQIKQLEHELNNVQCSIIGSLNDKLTIIEMEQKLVKPPHSPLSFPPLEVGFASLGFL